MPERKIMRHFVSKHFEDNDGELEWEEDNEEDFERNAFNFLIDDEGET